MLTSPNSIWYLLFSVINISKSNSKFKMRLFTDSIENSQILNG